MHYHIVPAPPLPGDAPKSASSSSSSSSAAKEGDKLPSRLKTLWASIGHGRTELADDEGAALSARIAAAVQADREVYDAEVAKAKL